MTFLRGKIKLGIIDKAYYELDVSNFTDYISKLNEISLKENNGAKFVFFLKNRNDYKVYNKEQYNFNDDMNEILSANENSKKTVVVNKIKKELLASGNVGYYVKYNEKCVRNYNIETNIRDVINKTTSSYFTNKNIIVLKNTYGYRKSIEALDELITLNPGALKVLFDDYINDKDVDILTYSYAKYIVKRKEISKERMSKNEVLSKYKNSCKYESLTKEIDRIYDVKDFKNIQGVNYLFNENDVILRQKGYEVLANALYSSGRLVKPYYSIIEIDVCNKEIRPVLLYLKTRLKLSRNELYFFEFIKIDDSSDPFVSNIHNFSVEQEKFYKIIKENQYTNTFGMYSSDEAKQECFSLSNDELIEKYSFVVFSEKLNKEAQLQYVKEKLNKYNQNDLLHQMIEIIECQDKQCDGLSTEELDDFILAVFRKKYEKVYKPVYNGATKDMTNGNVMEKLMNMVGLKNLKMAVNELRSKVNFQNINDELVPATKVLNQMTNFERNNWILTGAPGTGKSTAAEILEKVMYQEKIIKKDIIVKYTPSKKSEEELSIDLSKLMHVTSNDIEDSFKQAIGGVLVVDEIGHLSDQDKSLLLQLMEDNKKTVSVILCGYENEANDLLDYNPGFRSRFTHIIKMEEYTVEELYQILQNKLSEKHFYMKESLKENMIEMLTNIKGIPNFGQARFMESLSDKLIGIHSSNKMKVVESIVANKLNKIISEKEIYEIDEEDIKKLPLDEMTGNEYSAIVKHKDAFNELKSLIGCETVKNTIDDFVSKTQLDKIRIERKLIDKSSLNMNMVFYGAPGTAKTTVARLVGKIMYNKGIIRTPKVTEVGASDLVAAYVGQTALKTVSVFEKAKGGVLFIDEAYTLANTQAGGYNQEAIDTIIKEMENNRGNTMVIFAGYKNKMEDFIKCNPGFKSRISRFVDFPNYSKEELIKIFLKLVKDNKYELDMNDKDKILCRVGDYLEEKMNESDFGNGRTCRTILEDAISKQSKRISNANLDNISDEDLMTLKNEDFIFNTVDFYTKSVPIGFLGI